MPRLDVFCRWSKRGWDVGERSHGFCFFFFRRYLSFDSIPVVVLEAAGFTTQARTLARPLMGIFSFGAPPFSTCVNRFVSFFFCAPSECSPSCSPLSSFVPHLFAHDLAGLVPRLLCLCSDCSSCLRYTPSRSYAFACEALGIKSTKSTTPQFNAQEIAYLNAAPWTDLEMCIESRQPLRKLLSFVSFF